MIETVKLSNGVSIVMEQIDYFRSVSIGIFVKNGVIHENLDDNGISHFIEHMMFKGTENRSAKDIAEEMDFIGGQLNAFTSKEYTCYYVRVLDEHLDNAIDILCDMLFNSKFEQEEIEKEKKVILEEISMYEDNPEDVVFTELQKNVWNGSPLGYDILGTAKSIESFKTQDFFNYLKKMYVGENTVVSIAGSFDKKRIIQTLENNFKVMEKGTKAKDLTKQIYKPSIIKRAKDIEQVNVCISFEGVHLNSKYNYAMSVLNTILGGGMSSILFQKVREQNGLVYSIYSYNSAYVNNGIYNIYASLNPSNFDKYLEIIKEELNVLKKESINETQLIKTKEQLKSGYIMGLENTSNRMSSMGRSKVLIDKIRTSDKIIEEVNSISKEDIDYLIQNMFNLNKMSICAVGNVENLNL